MKNYADVDVKIKAIDKDTVDFDGELFYHWRQGFMFPYRCFNMIKVRFVQNYRIAWNEEFKIISVPIQLVQDVNIRYNYFGYSSLFLSKKDYEFVTELASRYISSLDSGPDSTPDAFSITSNGKFPKVIKNFRECYFYYDQKLYDKYR